MLLKMFDIHDSTAAQFLEKPCGISIHFKCWDHQLTKITASRQHGCFGLLPCGLCGLLWDQRLRMIRLTPKVSDVLRDDVSYTVSVQHTTLAKSCREGKYTKQKSSTYPIFASSSLSNEGICCSSLFIYHYKFTIFTFLTKWETFNRFINTENKRLWQP